MATQFTFIDFCSGIGGGRAGLERISNTRCLGFSEINKSSEKTYRNIFNDTSETNYGDFTKINIDDLPYFDIMLAGFPCQTFSVLGQRKGFEDDRGQIIYYLIDILKKKQVPYFILENVKGLINHDKGQTLKTIIKDLEQAGYFVGYKVLSSLNYGVPQMRERVYFIGVKKDKKTNGKYEWPLSIPTPNLKNYLIDENSQILDENDPTFQKLLNNKYNKGKFDIKSLLNKDFLVIDTRQSDLRLYEGKVPTLRAGRHGILYVRNKKLHKLSGYESLLLQGFNQEIAKKVSKEIPEQNLLFQTGNAMTVTVIEALGRKLIEYMNRV